MRAELMNRMDIVHRRYQAMRMYEPEKVIDFIREEAFILFWPSLKKLDDRLKNRESVSQIVQKDDRNG